MTDEQFETIVELSVAIVTTVAEILQDESTVNWLNSMAELFFPSSS